MNGTCSTTFFKTNFNSNPENNYLNTLKLLALNDGIIIYGVKR